MDSSASDTLQPGYVIGGCTIESLIASGGMGAVYRAHKKLLDRKVAVKVMRRSIAPCDDYRSRFLREAKVAAGLDHPAIVHVVDVAEENGLYFMVMEYVDGCDLRSFVAKNGPFSPRKALRIMRQVADALAYAHGKGLVHRDVKPANILMAGSSHVKLVDFGLARLVDQDHEITQTGQVLGTPVYMSPEQCRGDMLDGRSDIYSLGATLYFMLSGATPFKGDSSAALIHKVVNENPIPLQSQAPHLSEDVVALVQRLMAKYPNARYQTGEDVVAAIEERLAGRFAFSSETRVLRNAHEGSRIDFWAKTALALLMIGVLCAGIYMLAPRGRTQALPAGGAVSAVPAVPQQQPQAGSPPVSALARARKQTPAPVPPQEPPPGLNDTPWDDALTRLHGRVGKFLEVLCTDRHAELPQYLDPEAGRALQLSLSSAIRTIERYSVRNVKFRSSITQPGCAVTHMLVSDTGADSAQITVSWVSRNGAWYVSHITDRPTPP